MGKKSKSKSPQSRNSGWLIAGAAVIMAGAIWLAIGMTNDSSDSSMGLVMPDFETLDPSQFTGKARDAYQAAKDVPEVLAQMPCYCGCFQNFGHQSNLFCFRDEHGEHCDMCLNIAIEARDLYREGKSVEAIRDEIRTRYAAYAP